MSEFKDLLDWVEHLKHSDKLIIVEGKKDVRALKKLGITNTRPLKSPLYNEVEKVCKYHKEVIILTDLDKEGKKIYGRLKKDFNRFGVKVDCVFREFLFKNTKLTQIEGIDTYLEHK